jgi:hypothetical protein
MVANFTPPIFGIVTPNGISPMTISNNNNNNKLGYHQGGDDTNNNNNSNNSNNNNNNNTILRIRSQQGTDCPASRTHQVLNVAHFRHPQ